MRVTGGVALVVFLFALQPNLGTHATCAPPLSAIIADPTTYSTAAYEAAEPLCTLATWPASTPTTALDLGIVAMCEPASNSLVCVDECVVRLQEACMSDIGTTCVLVPGSGASLNCVDHNKLCVALNQTFCSQNAFCVWSSSSGLCMYSGLHNLTSPPAESVALKCPTLQPVVIVMLVLMLLTLVAGFGLVAWIVIRNQRRADKEEREREIAEAMEIEAKRARIAARRRAQSEGSGGVVGDASKTGLNPS